MTSNTEQQRLSSCDIDKTITAFKIDIASQFFCNFSSQTGSWNVNLWELLKQDLLLGAYSTNSVKALKSNKQDQYDWQMIFLHSNSH